MKKCPYCAEEIQDEAIVCRFCGRELTEPPKKRSFHTNTLIALFGGLCLATLVLIPKLLDPLVNLKDLLFHFITNTLIWTGVILLFIKLWANKTFKIVLLILLSLGIIYLVVENNRNYELTNSLLTKTTVQDPTYTPRIRRTATTTTLFGMITTPGWRPSRFTQEANEYNPFFSKCNSWYSLTDDDIGYTRCVYGKIVKIHTTDTFLQIIRFSDEAGSFLIRGLDKSVDVERGMCIAAKGNVQKDVTYLFMDLDSAEVYNYDGCK